MKKKIFLTFDMDWACDEVLEDTYQLIRENNLSATLIVTHNTKWLSRFRTDLNMELGIHPNFNPLLHGSGESNYKEVINGIRKIVPEAVTVRSHSLVSSTPLIGEFIENNLKYELNAYIPPHKGSTLFPFYRSNRILSIPTIFEDDLYLEEQNKYDVNYYLDDQFAMLRVFNFHPIHIFLNTEHMSRYENCKKDYHNGDKLKEYINKEQNGIRQFFLQLIQLAKAERYEFCCINELGGGEWR